MPVVPVFPLSAALSLAVFTIQRSLHPLYGSAPTRKYLLSVVGASSAATVFAPALSIANSLWLISLLLAAAPSAIYYTGVYTADSWKDASKGVPASLAVVILPLMYASMGVIKHIAVSPLLLLLLRYLIFFYQAPDMSSGFAIAELVIAVVTTDVIVDSCVASLWPNIPGIWMVEDEFFVSILVVCSKHKAHTV
jgi:hypothetical protein